MATNAMNATAVRIMIHFLSQRGCVGVWEGGDENAADSP
jgi:hypothetical protein